MTAQDGNAASTDLDEVQRVAGSEPLASGKPHPILPVAAASNDAQDARDERGTSVTAGRDRLDVSDDPTQRVEAETTPEGAKGWETGQARHVVPAGGHGLDVAPDASPEGVRAETRRLDDRAGGEPSNAPTAAPVAPPGEDEAAPPSRDDLCECGHEWVRHLPSQRGDLCHAIVYRDGLPLGGGAATQCDCTEFRAVGGVVPEEKPE